MAKNTTAGFSQSDGAVGTDVTKTAQSKIELVLGSFKINRKQIGAALSAALSMSQLYPGQLLNISCTDTVKVHMLNMVRFK